MTRKHQHPEWAHSEAAAYIRDQRRARARVAIGLLGFWLSVLALAALTFWGA